MGVLALRLTDFRNIPALRLEVAGRDVFLVGNNGQGKTNFLEAVYVLCYGASFRTRNDRDLIANGAGEAALWGRLSAGGEERGVGVALGAAGVGKRIAIDGKRIRDRARLIEFAPAIAFTHEDLRFIDGDPERRRNLFDHTLSLFDPAFIDVLRRYRRALRARNALLRAGDGSHVDVYDPTLAAAGAEIQRRRAELCRQFSGVFAELCAAIGDVDGARMEYRPSWRGAAAAEAQALLHRQRHRDLQLRTTTSGPHRDDVLFTIGQARFAAQGSTGQKRLASLVLRVAQAEFFHRTTGRRPILLLDDVLLELDAGKRERFLDQLPAYDQAFFTFLPDEPHRRYGGARTLRLAVAAGTFRPCTEPPTC